MRFANDNSKSQEVYLEGEAYFEVMPNVKRVFYVALSRWNGEGARYQLQRKHVHTRSTCNVLVAGKVDLIAQDSSRAQLTPGNAGIYLAGKWQIEPVDTMQALAWRQGIQYFEQCAID